MQTIIIDILQLLIMRAEDSFIHSCVSAKAEKFNIFSINQNWIFYTISTQLGRDLTNRNCTQQNEEVKPRSNSITPWLNDVNFEVQTQHGNNVSVGCLFVL